PWLKWVVVAPAAVYGILATCAETLAVEHLRSAQIFALPVEALSRWALAFYGIPISLFFTNLGIKSGTLESCDGRRRMRLILNGSMISLTAIFIVNLIGVARDLEYDTMPKWLTAPALVLLFLFPATLAYVIVVQRAMDVRMVIRQGLKYALARGGIVVIRG